MKTKLIIYDFDGVLTDNRVWLTQDGTETVVCNRSDGLWIGKFKDLGIEQIIISGEANPVVSVRANKLKIEAIQGVSNKIEVLKKVLKEKGLKASEVCYVGNDVNDLECMQAVGVSAAPNDAHDEVLKIAKHILPVPGGAGIVPRLYQILA